MDSGAALFVEKPHSLIVMFGEACQVRPDFGQAGINSLIAALTRPHGSTVRNHLQDEGVLAVDLRSVELMQRQTLETLTAPIRRQWQCNR